MALQLQHRKKDNKYRAWTTIADGWLTGWITRKSMVEYLQSRVMRTANEECEEIELTFPNGYWSRQGVRFWDDELEKKRKEMWQKRLSKTKLF